MASLLAGVAGCTGSREGRDRRDEIADPVYVPPAVVTVQPLFFVASDAAMPTAVQQSHLGVHLAWAQERYAELLEGRTFVVEGDPQIVTGAQTLAAYHALPEDGVPAITAELLARDGASRWSDPRIHVAIVMDPAYYGGGRTVNGGFTGGPGIAAISSAAFDAPNFQSTLQHELGHTLGLPHVDVYGYSMTTNGSMMSYDESHWTNGFEDSPTPGIFIPEDLRGLSWNDRALADYSYAAAPSLAPPVCLGPMDLPGLPSNDIVVTTPSGSLFGSSVASVVQGTRVLPNEGPGVTFDAMAMWQSDTVTDGWAQIDLEFPVEVTLDAIAVHTQHSGQYNEADAVRVERERAGSFSEIAREEGIAPDATITFAEPRTSSNWRVFLRAGSSGQVTVRGLRFFTGGVEVFPFCVPYGG